MAVGVMAVLSVPALSGCATTTPLIQSSLQDSIPEATRDSVRAGGIYAARTGTWIDPEALYSRLRAADYVLLGEVHDDPTHHDLQHRLLQEILREGRRPAVVFEMFNRRDAGVIASAIRQSPDDADAIAAAVNWDESGWPDWQMYKPIVDTALLAGLPIEAGNISRTELKHIVFGRGWQSFDKRILDAYGMFDPLPEEAEARLRQTLLHAHGGEMPEELVTSLFLAQRLRDANLADAMLAGNDGDGAVLIAGREHARLDHGVPSYLRYREPGTGIASVTFMDEGSFEDAFRGPDAARPAHDFVWLLPSSEVDAGRTAHP
jgi:uncharacterized iron-regulated protein